MKYSLRKNPQTICDIGRGDCFRACMTSMLGVPNRRELPNVDSPDWFLQWYRILSECGIGLVYEHQAFWRSGYWIASVKSKNFEKVTHAIIMNFSKVWFDPSPKERYEEGLDLLGSDLVRGGWYFEIIDFGKLDKLEELRKRWPS